MAGELVTLRVCVDWLKLALPVEPVPVTPAKGKKPDPKVRASAYADKPGILPADSTLWLLFTVHLGVSSGPCLR